MSESGKRYLYTSIGKEMNSQLSFVTENPYLEQDNSNIQLKSFALPDGQTVGVSFSIVK